MNLQEIYVNYVGEFGRYQLMVLCLLLILRSPSVIHNMGYVFFARTPDHSCSFDRNFELNFTKEEWKMFSVPMNEKTWSHCELYTWSNHVNNLTVDDVNSTLMALRRGESFGEEFRYRCDHWDYDTWTDVHDSLVTQVRSHFEGETVKKFLWKNGIVILVDHQIPRLVSMIFDTLVIVCVLCLFYCTFAQTRNGRTRNAGPSLCSKNLFSV